MEGEKHMLFHCPVYQHVRRVKQNRGAHEFAYVLSAAVLCSAFSPMSPSWLQKGQYIRASISGRKEHMEKAAAYRMILLNVAHSAFESSQNAQQFPRLYAFFRLRLSRLSKFSCDESIYFQDTSHPVPDTQTKSPSAGNVPCFSYAAHRMILTFAAGCGHCETGGGGAKRVHCHHEQMQG
jgi:hypothetical protein